MNPHQPIRTMDDLTELWRFVDGGHGYSAPQHFAIYLDRDSCPVPHVIQMYDDEFEDGPDDDILGLLMQRHAELIDDVAPGGSLAMMKARPGPSPLTAADRRWCRALHRELMAAPFASKPLFFATDHAFGLVPPDELITGAAAN